MSQQEISESCDVFHFSSLWLHACFQLPSVQQGRSVCSKAAPVKQTAGDCHSSAAAATQQQQQLRPAAALLQKAEPAFPASSAAASSSDAMQQQASPTQTLAWQQGNPSPPPPQLRSTASSDARWCAADFSAENYSASLPQTRLESLRLRQKAA